MILRTQVRKISDRAQSSAGNLSLTLTRISGWPSQEAGWAKLGLGGGRFRPLACAGMFTGLVEETGSIAGIQPGDHAIRLVVAARVCARGTRVGDSMAVNGACLTVVKLERPRSGARLHFDLLQETWTRTSLHLARVGGAVNLERALAANARIGGHFVTGHVDGLGTITRWEHSGKDQVLEIRVPAPLRAHLVPKGSVAVDGISLTVAAVTRTGFRVWIIPHTLEVTALRERKVGDPVNLETDLLGKYVERLLAWRPVPRTHPRGSPR